jgi:hypothetical protein
MAAASKTAAAKAEAFRCVLEDLRDMSGVVGQATVALAKLDTIRRAMLRDAQLYNELPACKQALVEVGQSIESMEADVEKVLDGFDKVITSANAAKLLVLDKS